jgi:hypothetical protein
MPLIRKSKLVINCFIIISCKSIDITHWSNINIYLTTHINDIMNATNEYNIQTELITDMHIQTELITEMHIYNEYAQIHNFFLTSWN